MAIQYTLEGKSFNYFFGWNHCCYDMQIIFLRNKKFHDPQFFTAKGRSIVTCCVKNNIHKSKHIQYLILCLTNT